MRLRGADAIPTPSIVDPGVVLNGAPAGGFGDLGSKAVYPDALGYRLKLGLLVPATNTSMEHELWRLLIANRETPGLDGIALQTSRVVTPRPTLRTESDLLQYRQQFLDGLRAATDAAVLANPHALIMGMSLEHILEGINPIRSAQASIESYSGIWWSTWHDAAPAALSRIGARRIGLLSPFDRVRNRNAARMFEELGFEVVASVGFACASADHIAHLPDWAKERAILELLATPENRLDAVVQCGTNMSLAHIAERLEPRIGIPILGINATTFWYALREIGITGSLLGGGRLLREH